MQPLKGIQATELVVHEVRYCPATEPCPRCGHEAKPVWQVPRVALDLSLEGPTALLLTVTVHRCEACGRYFRARPPFLRSHATYTNRVVRAAVRSVFDDGMAMGRVADRMARDFWLRPSASAIRGWCRAHLQSLAAFEDDYEPFVVRTFSGVLCVDEVYQGQLALLLAVEPAVGGDRLIGFQLVHGNVDASDVESFLARLKARGIEPEQVVTDGSALYPKALAHLWPQAAHQLCLFHAHRAVNEAVMKVVRRVQRELPVPPRPASSTLTGRLRLRHHPDASDPRDRDVCIARVLSLRRQGHAIRTVARMTGHSTNTVRSWLRGTVRMPVSLPDVPPEEAGACIEEATVPPSPPPGWQSWEEVRSFRASLQQHRFVLSIPSRRRTPEQEAVLERLFAAPPGPTLKAAQAFAQDWCAIFRGEDSRTRSVEEARRRFEALRTSRDVEDLPPLRRIQAAMTDAFFDRLSPFLTDIHWQATSNAAERMGRAFRQLQATHYNLRTRSAIEGALKARALRSIQPENPAARSSRGRKRTAP